MAVAHCDISYDTVPKQDGARSTYRYTLSGHGYEVRGASNALLRVRNSSCGMFGTYIGSVTHTNGWDLETFDSMGVPPVGRAEETNLLLSREFGDEFGDGNVQEIARHVGELDGDFATTETKQAGDAEP